MSDKTEDPTPKRLRKAQEEGDGPLSVFASQSVAFVCAVGITPAAVFALVTRAGGDLRAAIARAGDASPVIAFDPIAIATAIVALSAPILVAAGVSGAIASIVQTGGVIATKKLTPDLDRLNPIGGANRLLSTARVVAVLRAALFAAAVTWIVGDALRSSAASLARTAGRLDEAMTLASTIALDVAKRTAIVGLVVAVLDIIVTRRSWRKKLKMSKEEVKREHKESEGDPQLKAARMRAHHERLASATLDAVTNASVVIVDSTRIACALRYDSPDRGGSDEAPVLIASGYGDLAKRIVEATQRYGVPIARDTFLAQALVELEIGDAIPETLYEAIAEVLREALDEAPSESRTS